MRILVLLIVLSLVAAACSSSSAAVDSIPSTTSGEPVEVPAVVRGEAIDFGSPPVTPTGPLSEELAEAVDTFFGRTLGDGIFLQNEWDALDTIRESGDVRLAWLVADLLQLARGSELLPRVKRAADELMGRNSEQLNPWSDVMDHLIAWDVPAPPNYATYKSSIYTLVEREWGPLIVESDLMDWRFVSWGGVRIDDRPYDTTDDHCNCIPAADNPEVSAAEEAAWLDDDAVIFGVEINGEARAYPRRIMEVREMVNDTLGGRDFGMPYCTLCGSAQVFFTDEVDGFERPVFRTSGLLNRSNKVMYDITTWSVLDTFLGTALTGPLAEAGVVLPQHSVVTTSWGDWKAAHPDTTVLIEDLAMGRDFDFRNNRDADGPIFPIGDVDDRLPVQEDVIGIILPDGVPIAFHAGVANAMLRNGEAIEVDGVKLVLDGGGVRAVDSDGADLGSHQSFWFAWSQFHPDTELWVG